MLIRAHLVFIACSVLFCLGMAVHQFIAYRREAAAISLYAAAIFLAGGFGLSFYLRSVWRRHFKGR